MSQHEKPGSSEGAPDDSADERAAQARKERLEARGKVIGRGQRRAAMVQLRRAQAQARPTQALAEPAKKEDQEETTASPLSLLRRVEAAAKKNREGSDSS